MFSRFNSHYDTASPSPQWIKHYPEGVDWNLVIEPKLLHTMLEETVHQFPEHVGMDFLSKEYSYAQLGRMVDKAAAGFQKLGVVKGTKIGLMLPNSPFYVVCFFAALKAGATVVNFNPLCAPRELCDQILDSNTDIMVTMDLHATYDQVKKAIAETPLKMAVMCSMKDVLPWPKSLLYPYIRHGDIADYPFDQWHISFEELLDNDGKMSEVPLDARADVALLQYTGGTTGSPKGAILTHANLYINAVQCGLWFTSGIDGAEKTLGVLPFYHIFGLTTVMTLSILRGFEIIALPEFNLEDVLNVIERKRPTLFPAVPTIFGAIVGSKKLHRYDLCSIKYCISGGAPLSTETRETFIRLTDCALVEGYGLTEAAPVVACNPPDGVTKAGSIGIPVPATSLTIVDINDPTKVVPCGEKGIIAVSGPQVMLGYYNNLKETRDTIINGRLITGDVGVMDEDGYVRLIDRVKDVIITSGFNIYPSHVEKAVYRHPSVAECICAGIPDSYRGESVKIWVRLKPDASDISPEELKLFLREYLSPIEMPRQIEFRGEPLPKTSIGKLSRAAIVLQDIHSDRVSITH